MLNKVMLIGNVGADPEVRYLENQNQPQYQGQNQIVPKVASFRLATTERFRDRNGELRENTEWHNIVAWRRLADLCEKFIRKGSQIYVEGRLTTRSWDGQDGQKHYQTEIVADDIQLLGKRNDSQQPGVYQGPAQGQAQPRPVQSYNAPQQGGYGQPQPAYGAPAQPAYVAPAQGYSQPQPAPIQQMPAQTAPAPAADGGDDLPF